MEKEFSFDEYRIRTLEKMQDKEDREYLNSLLNGVFLPLTEYVETNYNMLKDKVIKETVEKRDRDTVYTALIPRENFDLRVNQLYPMDPLDLEERTITTKKILDGLSEQGSFFVYRIFVGDEYPIVRELILTNPKFKGKVITNEDEYEAVFELRQNLHYFDKMKELYSAFTDNGLAWKTICAPHLFRAFDVFLSYTDCPDDEEVQELQIDFGEYEHRFLREMVPVWNVRKITETTSTYPMPEQAELHYEHVIYRHRLDPDSEYLPISDGIPMFQAEKRKGDLYIVCPLEKPRQWKLFEITAWKKQPQEFLYFQNGIQMDGILKYSCMNGIRTRAEVFHFVKMLGYDNSVRLEHVFLTSQKVESETYTMDPFLIDEIRTEKGKEHLVLDFTAIHTEDVYRYDIMSYLVSRVQWFYPEYDCVGTFGKIRPEEERK